MMKTQQTANVHRRHRRRRPCVLCSREPVKIHARHTPARASLGNDNNGIVRNKSQKKTPKHPTGSYNNMLIGTRNTVSTS